MTRRYQIGEAVIHRSSHRWPVKLLLHHAVIIPIEGNSYRLREHAALLPQTMRPRSSLLDLQGQQPIKRRPGRPPKKPRANHLG